MTSVKAAAYSTQNPSCREWSTTKYRWDACDTRSRHTLSLVHTRLVLSLKTLLHSVWRDFLRDGLLRKTRCEGNFFHYPITSCHVQITSHESDDINTFQNFKTVLLTNMDECKDPLCHSGKERMDSFPVSGALLRQPTLMDSFHFRGRGVAL